MLGCQRVRTAGTVPTTLMLAGALLRWKMLQMAMESTVTVSGPAARMYTSFLQRSAEMRCDITQWIAAEGGREH